MDVSPKIQNMLDKMTLDVGAVVHTVDKKQPVRATKTADGWEFEKEEWNHGVVS